MGELLERDDLLSALSTLAMQASQRGSTVLVSGEAGVGKTSLLERFAAGAPSGRILWGSCEALTTPRPLGPLHDIAAQCGGELARRLASHVQPAAGASLFPAVLEELARPPAPTVMIFEDIHWADAATLDLVKYLGRRIRQVPALLVLSHRDDAASLDRLRPLLGELPAAHVQRLAVPLLSRAAVGQLADSASREADAARIHAATGGNAFFVAELLRQGASGAGGGGEDTVVPPTVRDAVLARAAPLPAAAQEVLHVVAIVPAHADAALVDTVLAPAIDAVDACVASGLLIAEGRRLRFRHELARTSVEASIPPLRAARLHARVLAALAARPTGSVALAALAHHAEGADDPDAVLRWAPEAAREAVARGARREAAAHCRAALAHGERLADAERAALLDELAALSFELNDLASAIAAGEEAVALHARCGNVARQSASLSALAMSLVRSLRNDEADAASRRAIALAASEVPPGMALARALATESYLRMLNRDCADAVECGEEAIALARAAGDAATEARATLAAGTATMFIDYPKGVARLEQLLGEARRVDDGGALLADTHQMLATGSAELHAFDVAEAHLAEGIATAHRRDLDRVAGYMESWQAICDLFRGRWTLAGERAHAAVRTQAAGSTNRVVALVALARVRIRRGDPGADELLDEALALATRSGTLQRLGPVAAARAEAAWLRGDNAGALAEVSRAIGLAAKKRHPWLLGELAYWRWQATRQARDGDVAAPAPAGVVDLGDAADPYRRQIEGDWQNAAAAWRAMGCPYEEARALGEGDEPAQRAALALLDRLGARPLAERIRRVLRDAGARAVPRGANEPTRLNVAGLTRREAEVLELLARGYRNARIAAEAVALAAHGRAPRRGDPRQARRARRASKRWRSRASGGCCRHVRKMGRHRDQKRVAASLSRRRRSAYRSRTVRRRTATASAQETAMPRYLVERTFPNGLAIPQTAQGAEACLGVVDNNAQDGVTWVHSYVNPDRTKTFCIYDGPRPSRSARPPSATSCRSTPSRRCQCSIRTSIARPEALGTASRSLQREVEHASRRRPGKTSAAQPDCYAAGRHAK